MYSLHVDLNTPGDRRSDCHARMKPIGLIFKDYSVNPFTNRGSGELMIVHQCLNCGKISPNRIAGDDNEYQILQLLEEPENLGNIGIHLLTQKDKEKVTTNLFGFR